MSELVEFPKWFDQVAARVTKLLELEENWDSYGAIVVDPAAVSRALEVLKTICDEPTPQPHVGPTVDGGVQIEWHQCGIDLEVVVHESGVGVYYQNEHGESWEPDFDCSAGGDLAWLLLVIRQHLRQMSIRGEECEKTRRDATSR